MTRRLFLAVALISNSFQRTDKVTVAPSSPACEVVIRTDAQCSVSRLMRTWGTERWRRLLGSRTIRLRWELPDDTPLERQAEFRSVGNWADMAFSVSSDSFPPESPSLELRRRGRTLWRGIGIETPPKSVRQLCSDEHKRP